MNLRRPEKKYLREVKMLRKTGWLGERFCLLCGAGFCGLIFLQSVQRVMGIGGIVTAGSVICVCAVVYLILKYWRLGTTGTSALIFMVRFVLALTVIFFIGAEPVQDFRTMYTAAQELAQGGRGYLDNIYYYNWAYQTGFVVYERLLLKLFGPGQLSLQVMNAVWMGGIGVLVHRIALCILPARAAVCAGLLYAVYPAPYFLAAVLTNQHICVFFLYLAVWLLIRRQELSVGGAVLAGGVIAIGNIMRPIGVVLILAVVCWQIVRCLLHRGRDWKRTLGYLAAVVITYTMIFSLASAAIVWSGINPEGLSNNQPMWKFVLGFNQESSGAWNRYDYENYLMLPTEEADAVMREVVKERLSVEPIALLKLAVRKSAVMWGDLEYMYWGFGHLDGSQKIGFLTVDQCTQILALGDKGVYLVCFALALLGILSLLKRGTYYGGGALLLSFLLCGYYAVHLIVEVQARYRYFLIPAVAVLAGYGVETLRIFEYRKRKY